MKAKTGTKAGGVSTSPIGRGAVPPSHPIKSD